MTIQQLQYVVALNRFQNFIKAAESCLVTQPTITTQLKKLEDEVGMLIFDRSKVPLEPTKDGEGFVLMAQQILEQIEELKSWVNNNIDEVEGVLSLGVIPTVAPYLLPLLIGEMMDNHPQLTINVEEMTSEVLISAVRDEKVDLGILAGPINVHGIKQYDLYEEPFLVYAHPDHELLNHAEITPSMLEVYEDLWVLEQGHCLSTQTLNICNQNRSGLNHRFNYKSGSFDALLRMMKHQGGYTLIPYLLKNDLNADLIRSFKSPVPVREIKLIAKRTYNKSGVINALIGTVQDVLPNKMSASFPTKRIPWK